MSAYIYQQRAETYHVAANGDISRPSIGMGATNQWRITGAVRFNNFGHIVERAPFPECFEHSRAWTYKNGKARWCLTDYDHGTNRVQMCPVVYATKARAP